MAAPDLSVIVNGIAQDASGIGETTSPPISFEWIDTSTWDDTEPPDPEYTVFNRIPKRQVTLFSGEGAAGKSTVTHHLAAAHAAGRDWLGSMPEPGHAFLLEAEDDAAALYRRTAAICRYYGGKFSELFRGRLHLKSWAGEDAVLAAPDRNGRIQPTALYDALHEQAGDIKPRLIGIASSANVFAGNENSRTEVQQFIGLLTKLAIVCDGAVVLVSHPSLTGINTSSGLSGTTQWHNGPRGRMFMRTPRTDNDDTQPDTDIREIQFKKNQYGPLGETIVLRWQNGLFLPEHSSSGSLDKLAREAKIDDLFITLLRRCTGQGRNVSHMGSPTYAPAIFSKEAEAKELRISNTEFTTAMNRLFSAGKIRVATEGPPSKQRNRIVEAF